MALITMASTFYLSSILMLIAIGTKRVKPPCSEVANIRVRFKFHESVFFKYMFKACSTGIGVTSVKDEREGSLASYTIHKNTT